MFLNNRVKHVLSELGSGHPLGVKHTITTCFGALMRCNDYKSLPRQMNLNNSHYSKCLQTTKCGVTEMNLCRSVKEVLILLNKPNKLKYDTKRGTEPILCAHNNFQSFIISVKLNYMKGDRKSDETELSIILLFERVCLKIKMPAFLYKREKDLLRVVCLV